MMSEVFHRFEGVGRADRVHQAQRLFCAGTDRIHRDSRSPGRTGDDGVHVDCVQRVSNSTFIFRDSAATLMPMVSRTSTPAWAGSRSNIAYSVYTRETQRNPVSG